MFLIILLLILLVCSSAITGGSEKTGKYSVTGDLFYYIPNKSFVLVGSSNYPLFDKISLNKKQAVVPELATEEFPGLAEFVGKLKANTDFVTIDPGLFAKLHKQYFVKLAEFDKDHKYVRSMKTIKFFDTIISLDPNILASSEIVDNTSLLTEKQYNEIKIIDKPITRFLDPFNENSGSNYIIYRNVVHNIKYFYLKNPETYSRLIFYGLLMPFIPYNPLLLHCNNIEISDKVLLFSESEKFANDYQHIKFYNYLMKLNKVAQKDNNRIFVFIEANQELIKRSKGEFGEECYLAPTNRKIKTDAEYTTVKLMSNRLRNLKLYITDISAHDKEDKKLAENILQNYPEEILFSMNFFKDVTVSEEIAEKIKRIFSIEVNYSKKYANFLKSNPWLSRVAFEFYRIKGNFDNVREIFGSMIRNEYNNQLNYNVMYVIARITRKSEGHMVFYGSSKQISFIKMFFEKIQKVNFATRRGEFMAINDESLYFHAKEEQPKKGLFGALSYAYQGFAALFSKNKK